MRITDPALTADAVAEVVALVLDSAAVVAIFPVLLFCAVLVTPAAAPLQAARPNAAALPASLARSWRREQKETRSNDVFTSTSFRDLTLPLEKDAA
ncbi:MAG: hypothetical protein M1118_08345 [Chloroflexi bacterium]|nr:hypothetical protein [Chloroflexota bacterium]